MTLERSDIDHILNEVTAVIEGNSENKLVRICQVLHDMVEHYDWVGFYLQARPIE